MNKTLIAAAVSAALMAPVAAQAEATVYGRVHQGIAFVNNDEADSTTDFISVGSRFGIKGSSDLGNGLTASAHYEFTTSADTAGDGVSNTRIATVGLSGAFGSVNLGNQWSAWYNQLGVHVDPTFYVGGSHHIGPFRTANTIAYSNSFGPVSIQADARIDSGDDGGDGNAVGASIAINENITLAAAIDDSDAGSLTGLAAQVSLGNYWASIAQQSSNPEGDGADPSTVQLWVGGSWGNTSAMLGTGSHDDDAGGEPSDVTLGVYHDMGGGFKLLFESISKDTDGAVDDDGELVGDSSTHIFGVRLDF